MHQDYHRAAALATTFENAGISMSALNDRYFLDARALQSLARHPLASIGGHTTSHQALATLDAASARTELADNRNYLENLRSNASAAPRLSVPAHAVCEKSISPMKWDM